MKEKFDRNKYISRRYVMHCKTQDEFTNFLKYLDSLGEKWGEKNSSLLELFDLWENFKDRTVFYFNTNNAGIGAIENAKKGGYIILEYSDFDWSKKFTKADLKTGDVIKRRNGDVEIFNLELGMFIRSDGGWNDIDCINNDFSSTCYKDYDIIAVRRPITKPDCSFCAFSRNDGTLIYERKEVEEMTLEQVCKLLGKEIKIIK